MLEKINFSKGDELYLLGDFIDRGPDAMGVVNHIFHLLENGFKVRCVRGNHEEEMIASFYSIDSLNAWKQWGGVQTLKSFGVNHPRDLPEKHWLFFNSLKHYIELEKFILVHAGLNFKSSDPISDISAMLWIRNWYDQINYEWLGDRSLIHGHTPYTRKYIEASLLKLDQSKVLGIDNGCFAHNLPGKGGLCAFDLDNKSLYFQTNLDDMAGWK